MRRRRLQFGARPRCCAAVLGSVLMLAGAASASLLVVEQFDYPAGSWLRGQDGPGGWVWSWTALTDYGDYGRSLIIANTGLSHPQLPPAAGLSVTKHLTDRARVGGRRIRSPEDCYDLIQAGKEIWYSFLFVMPADKSGGIQVKLFAPDFGGEMGIGSNWGVGVEVHSSNGLRSAIRDVFTEGLQFAYGETHLVVGRIVWSGGPLWDSDYNSLEVSATNYVWLNPDLTNFPINSPNITQSGGGLYWNNNLGNNLQLRGSIPSSDFLIDEIRIGTTLASVIPEPSTVMSLTLGVLALVARRCSQRRF